MLKLTSFSLTLVVFVSLSSANINFAELEFLSDELPARDCFRLLQGLRDKSWKLNETRIAEVLLVIIFCSVFDIHLFVRPHIHR